MRRVLARCAARKAAIQSVPIGGPFKKVLVLEDVCNVLTNRGSDSFEVFARRSLEAFNRL